MVCKICNHEKRVEIEQALLNRQLGDPNETIEKIAKEFGVEVRDLQVHALMHVPVADMTGLPEDAKAEDFSLTAKLKIKEAATLAATMDEYYTTMKNLGRRINQEINEPDFLLSRGFSKNVAELYINCGANIRETANAIVKMNVAINGEGGSGADALSALVGAIQRSRPAGEEKDGD